RQFILAGATGLPVVVLYLIIAWLAAIAGARFAVRQYLGEPSSPGACIAFVFTHLWRAMRVLVLCLLVGLAMGTASVLPGAFRAMVAMLAAATSSRTVGLLLVLLGTLLAMGGAFLFFLWYVLRFLLIAPVTAEEDLGARQVLKRSRELISGRIGEGLMNRV